MSQNLRNVWCYEVFVMQKLINEAQRKELRRIVCLIYETKEIFYSIKICISAKQSKKTKAS